MRKKVLGAEHPDTLWAMRNLAVTYSNLRKWSEAEPVLYPAPPFPGGIAGIQAESRWLVGIGRIPGGFPPHSQ